MFLDPSMVQARDHKAAAKGKNKGRGSYKALKSMFKCVTSHLARGGWADKEEPLPPTAPGSHRRTVSSINGSIEYVKVGSQVSSPALSRTH